MAELTLEALAKRVEELERRLRELETAEAKDWRSVAGKRSLSDPVEQEFLEILAEQRRDDLEQTLRELDKECSV